MREMSRFHLQYFHLKNGNFPRHNTLQSNIIGKGLFSRQSFEFKFDLTQR